MSPIDLNSDMMYRLLVQSVVDYAIYLLSPEGVVTNWNAGAQRAKGYRAAEIVGQHFSVFYSAQERDAGVPQRGLQQARDTGRFEATGWRLRGSAARHGPAAHGSTASNFPRRWRAAAAASGLSGRPTDGATVKWYPRANPP